MIGLNDACSIERERARVIARRPQQLHPSELGESLRIAALTMRYYATKCPRRSAKRVQLLNEAAGYERLMAVLPQLAVLFGGREVEVGNGGL